MITVGQSLGMCLIIAFVTLIFGILTAATLVKQNYTPGSYEYALKVCEDLGGLKKIRIGLDKFEVICENTRFDIWNTQVNPNAK